MLINTIKTNIINEVADGVQLLLMIFFIKTFSNQLKVHFREAYILFHADFLTKIEYPQYQLKVTENHFCWKIQTPSKYFLLPILRRSSKYIYFYNLFNDMVFFFAYIVFLFSLQVLYLLFKFMRLA